jgi:hypothetical protein
MSLFMLVERVLAIEGLGAFVAAKLRVFVRLFMAPQMLLSAKGLIAKRALMAIHTRSDVSTTT